MRPNVRDIFEATAAFYRISVKDLVSENRSRAYAYPRQIAMFLARQMTPLSLPEIGRQFGRDHTTVLYACAKAIKRMDDREVLSAVISIAALATARARKRGDRTRLLTASLPWAPGPADQNMAKPKPKRIRHRRPAQLLPMSYPRSILVVEGWRPREAA